jgi:hypothetical protein
MHQILLIFGFQMLMFSTTLEIEYRSVHLVKQINVGLYHLFSNKKLKCLMFICFVGSFI